MSHLLWPATPDNLSIWDLMADPPLPNHKTLPALYTNYVLDLSLVFALFYSRTNLMV